MLKKLKFYFAQTLIFYIYKRILRFYEDYYTLPQTQIIIHQGVKLNVECLPNEMKRCILSGNYESYEIQGCSRLLNEHDSVLEIGAAIGYVGLFCQLQLGIKNYAVVEPNPKTADTLIKNYKLNLIKPNLIRAALSDKNGVLSIFCQEEFWADSLLIGKATGKEISVESLTFETVLQKLSFAPNALVIDIEGAEKYLPIDTIANSIRKIIIELHPLIIGYPDTFSLLAKLNNLGFKVQSVQGAVYSLQR